MGNTWRALVLGMMGLRPETDALRVDPCLPPEWPSLEVRVRYRGSLLLLHATPDGVTIGCDRPTRVRLGAGPIRTVAPGQHALP
jgi:cellobiose phosphorylase